MRDRARIPARCLAALAAIAWPAAAEVAEVPGRLTVELSPTAGLTVGDRVTAEVVLVWSGPEPTVEPRFPTWQETWGPAEVLAAGGVTSSTGANGRLVYRQSVTLTAFRTGEIQLPPITVAVPLAERTLEVRGPDGLTFEVGSVLPEGAGPTDGELEPRPAAPPQALAAGGRFPSTAGLLAALSLLAAAALRRRLAAGPNPSAAPRRRPLEELLERLAGLEAGAGGEPAHTGLSLALRHFLGRTIGIQGAESTTREIHRRLRSTEVPPALARRTVLLLSDCDQVKFARREAGAALTRGRLAATRDLAREIDGLLRPDPGDGAAAPAEGST